MPSLTKSHRKRGRRAARRASLPLALLTAGSLFTLAACSMENEPVQAPPAPAPKTINTVYAIGKHAQLELGHYQKKVVRPLLVQGIQGSVSSVAAGTEHTLVLTTDGSVYGFGNNALGQLGIDTNVGPCLKVACPYVNEPTLIASLPKHIRAIAASTDYSLAVTDSGSVYTFGGDALGLFKKGEATPQKAELEAEPHQQPRELSGLKEKVTDVSAGPKHTLFLTATGRVFALGDNCTGALGSDIELKLEADGKVKSCGSAKAPAAIAGLPDKITKIATGKDFSLVLTAAGEVYAFGSNAYGQLGNGKMTGACQEHCVANPQPQKVTGLPEKAIAIAAGDSHALVLTSSGKVYAFGANEGGQLGNTDPAAQPSPVLVANLPAAVQLIAAGSEVSYAIDKDGKLYGWGNNTDGILGELKTGKLGVPVGKAIELPDAATAISTGVGTAFVVVEHKTDH